MNLNQDNIQLITPLPELSTNRSMESLNNASSAVNVYGPPSQTSENLSENELRSPLREISDNTLEISEVAEQEQDLKHQESLDDGLGDINDYVAKIMEKLEKQKQKTAKLNSVLDNKEKGQHVQALANVFEDVIGQNDENCNVDVSAKENLSPVKARHATAVKNASPVKEVVVKHKLEEVLHVSKNDISYGYKFPGQVAEEHLDIINKSNHDFIVRIEVDCLNEDLQDTEEYVYSVRRSHLHEYNDRHYLIMAPYSCASFKFALKVPNMKVKGDIEGRVRVSIEDVDGCYELKMNTKVSIPKVFCPKELRVPGMGYSMINLACKEGKKQDFKLPIKNTGNMPVTMEFDFYEPKNQEDGEDKVMFDCLAHPSVLTVPANGTAQVNVIVKPWRVPKSKKGEKSKPTRKILIGKVRDSSLVYSFVLGVEFY